MIYIIWLANMATNCRCYNYASTVNIGAHAETITNVKVVNCQASFPTNTNLGINNKSLWIHYYKTTRNNFFHNRWQVAAESICLASTHEINNLRHTDDLTLISNKSYKTFFRNSWTGIFPARETRLKFVFKRIMKMNKCPDDASLPCNT